MKRIISLTTMIVLMFFGSTIYLSASENDARPMKISKIQKMDKKLTRKKAIKRLFKSQKEYQRMKQKKRVVQGRVTANGQRSKRRIRNANSILRENSKMTRRSISDDYWMGDERELRRARQTAYRNFKRGWYLAYRYDRANFNDRYGYHYGYFNQYGYYFDGVFYRYDRYYSYRDRSRGRGVFDRNYYMPSNYSYYGFANHTRRLPRSFMR